MPEQISVISPLEFGGEKTELTVTGNKLGEGGFGEVFRGSTLEEEVAIKRFRSLDQSSYAILDPQQEARLLRRLSHPEPHPNVVPFRGFGYQDGDEQNPVLWTKLVEGTSLNNLLTPEGMPFGESLPIALDVLRGLKYIHRKDISHGDIKPTNVQVTPWGKATLLDFGIAFEGIRSSDTAMGSPSHIAPEMVMYGQLSPQIDAYAAAILVYQMISGKHPLGTSASREGMYLAHLHEQPVHLREAIPPERVEQLGLHPKKVEEIGNVLALGLVKSPEYRSSVEELGRDLQRVARMMPPERSVVVDLGGSNAPKRMSTQQAAFSTDAVGAVPVSVPPVGEEQSNPLEPIVAGQPREFETAQIPFSDQFTQGVPSQPKESNSVGYLPSQRKPQSPRHARPVSRWKKSATAVAAAAAAGLTALGIGMVKSGNSGESIVGDGPSVVQNTSTPIPTPHETSQQRTVRQNIASSASLPTRVPFSPFSLPTETPTQTSVQPSLEPTPKQSTSSPAVTGTPGSRITPSIESSANNTLNGNSG